MGSRSRNFKRLSFTVIEKYIESYLNYRIDHLKKRAIQFNSIILESVLITLLMNFMISLNEKNEYLLC